MRGRKAKLYERRSIEVTLPADLVAKMQIELFSQATGNVPCGAVATLIEGLLRGWLEQRGVKM